MELRYFTWWKSPIDVDIESRQMVASHLISDFLTLGGQAALNLTLENRMSKLSLEEQLDFIYAFTSKIPSDEQFVEISNRVKHFFEQRKTRPKFNAKNRNTFVAFKKLESSFLDMSKVFLRSYNRSINSSAYSILKQMKETYPVGVALEGLAGTAAYVKQMNPTKMAEEILDFIFTPSTDAFPPIFTWDLKATLKIFNKEMEEFEAQGSVSYYAPTTIEAYYQEYESTPNFFEHWYNFALEIPPIRHLDALALMVLKKDMQASISEFNAVVDRWIKCRNNDKPTKELLAQTHIELNQAGEKLSNAFKAHPLCILNPYDNIETKEDYTFIFYTSTLVSLLDNFETYSILPNSVIEELRRITNNNPTYPSNLAVMAFIIKNAGIDELMKDAEIKNEQVVPNKKKSIDFD